MPHKWQGSVATIYVGHGFRDMAITGRSRNMTAGEGISSDKVGLPMGYRHPGAWMMPQKPGNLSSHNEARGVGAATLALVQGRALSGTASGSVVALGTGKLVVNISGSAAGSVTVAGNINAILGMSGTADGTSTVEAVLAALAWLSGSADGLATASLQSYAIGKLSGTVYVNEGTASTEQLATAVWSALTAENNEPGSMGEAMAAAGSAGDPWITNLPGAYTGTQAGAMLKRIENISKLLFYT